MDEKDSAKEAARKKVEDEERKAKEEKKQKRLEWSAEELSLLAKAIIKFPSGLSNRWKHISEYLGETRP